MAEACCSVGARPDVAEVNAALRAGEGLRSLAKRFPGASKSVLGRHRSNCIGIEVEKLGAEAPANAHRVRRTERDGTGRDTSRDAPKASRGRPADGSATPGNDARATRHSDVKALESFEDRVNHVADLIAAGDYLGRETANQLARQWGVGRPAIQNYARAAALLVRGDIGEREELRQISIARWQQLYVLAKDQKDVQAAAKAQAGWDRAAGVVEPGGARVQIQIGDSDFGRGCARFLLAVAPELAPEFAAWCGAVQAGDQVARADPARWLETRRRAIDTTAEAAE